MEKMNIKEVKKIYKENKGEIKNDEVDGFVVLKDINKIYPNHVQAVYDFSLSIKENEFIVLVGPSGCGKSTTLRMIAGLEEISSGYLYINKIIANHLESKDRNIAMVFQNYALYPNMTVYDNIAFGLKIKKIPNDEIKERVFNAAKILDLGSYLDRKPRELSGGQMQRVALGRAIVRDAKVFLMDEPLSNLDAKLRVQMRSEIVKIHKQIKTTTIYVTHDQTEAMTMADRIVVMNHGFIQQIGSPKDIYNNPKNIFVATFIGTPPMNIFKANLSSSAIFDEKTSFEVKPNLFDAYKKFLVNKKEYFSSLKNLIIDDEIKEISDLAKDKNNVDKIEQKLISIKENNPLLNKEVDVLLSLLNDAKESKKYKKLIKKFITELKEINYVLIGEMRKVKSSSSTSFTTVSSTTSTKDKKDNNKLSFNDEYLAAKKSTENYLSIYSKEMDNYDLYFGIRPEDIHLKEDKVKHKSKEMEVEISFFELMGSEYLVHFNLFNTNLIMKMSNSKDIKLGDKTNIVFDLDKLKIFDKESGENILWEK